MNTILSIFRFSGRLRGTFYGGFSLVTLFVLYEATTDFCENVLLAVLRVIPHEVTEELIQRISPTNIHAFDAELHKPLGLLMTGLILSLLAIIVFWLAWTASSVRRLHDMNITGWAALAFIPIVGLPYVSFAVAGWLPYVGYVLVWLVLTLSPSSKGANRFGADPRLPMDITAVFEGS